MRRQRPSYLIEVRLRGQSKAVTKNLIFDISKKFHVWGNVKKRPVPHVTLFGPFYTRSIKDIIQTMQKIGNSYSSLPYEITGFDFFEFKKGIIFKKDLESIWR